MDFGHEAEDLIKSEKTHKEANRVLKFTTSTVAHQRDV